MKILLVVDCQKEFVRDSRGQKLYTDIIKYISNHRIDYDEIWSTVYQNGDNVNMQRLLNWENMFNIEELEYKADRYFLHSGYAPVNMDSLTSGDTVTIVGFDTDACVLATCFSLWDKQITIRILANGCYSSGGETMHQSGLCIMQRQFGNALDMITRLDE